jgi:hypothetical protein
MSFPSKKARAMSIISASGSELGSMPRSPNVYEEGETWASYLEKNVFHELKHGEPFLIIQRLIDREFLRTDHPRVNALKVTYYIGFLAKDGKLFEVASDTYFGQIVIRTKVLIESADILRHRGISSETKELRISSTDVYRTPLKEEFIPPQGLVFGHQKIRAFDVAIGVEAMEQLFMKEEAFGRHRDFTSWYIRSVLKLGLPFQLASVRLCYAEQKLKILTELLDKHRQISGSVLATKILTLEMRALIKMAQELKVGQDRRWTYVCGIRYVPKMLFDDLVELYVVNSS